MIKCGLIGLPNVGKSTIFNLIAGRNLANVGDYEFCTIDPNTAEVEVKDKNIDKLAEIFKSQSIVYPKITIVDIAGLIHDAHKGAGLGNAFLSHIRSVDLRISVIGIFKTLSSERTIKDAKAGLDIISEELILSDISRCMKILDSRRTKQYTNDQKKIIQSAFNILNQNIELIYSDFDTNQLNEMQKLGLITAKPVVYAFNLTEDLDIPEDFNDLNPKVPVYADKKLKHNVDILIQECYKSLGLITFYTAGPKEARGWKIQKGTVAKTAAGAIHSDIQNKFISVEVRSLDAINAPTRKNKDYVMQDGDICDFKHGK